jgi:hypothetical protein
MRDRRVATFFYGSFFCGSFMDDNILKQLGVVAERSEVAVFVIRHHTRMIANQNGSVYSRDVRPHTQSTGRTNGTDVRSIPNSSPKLSWR